MNVYLIFGPISSFVQVHQSQMKILLLGFMEKLLCKIDFICLVTMYNVGMCLVLERERPFGSDAASGSCFVVISRHIENNEICLTNLVITIGLLD